MALTHKSIIGLCFDYLIQKLIEVRWIGIWTHDFDSNTNSYIEFVSISPNEGRSSIRWIMIWTHNLDFDTNF